MSEARPPGGRRRTLVREVNPHLICVLCSGYFIEATTIVECLHTFCRSCLVKYLENNKFCPKCDVQLHKNNPLLSVRCDPTLQQLVYKLIPGLYSNEMARRRKYYSELGGPTSDPDCGVFPIGDQYFSPDDSISLSLEFINGAKDEESGSDTDESAAEKQAGMSSVHHRRYLQCPAAVTMSHLKKFLRMKYCLSQDHKVDIIYGGEVLTDDFSLMDVAYTFSWNKTTPMRFKFRLLQRYSVPVPEPPPSKDLEIREPTSTPKVVAEPEVSVHKEPAPKIQLKTLTVQVQKLSSNIVDPLMYKSDIKPNKLSVESSVVINNNNNYGPPKGKPLVRHKPGPKSRTEGRARIEIKPTVKTSPDRGNVLLKRPLHSDEDPLQIHEDNNEPEKKKSKFSNTNDSLNKHSAHLSDNESESMSPLEKIYDEPLEERKRKMEEEERRKKKEEEEEKRKKREEEEKRKKKEEEEKRKKREEEEKRRKREEEERKRKREEEEKKKRKEEEEKRKRREEEERRRRKEEEDRRRKKEEEERRKKKEEKMLAEEKKNYDDDIYEIGKWHMDSKKVEEKKQAVEKMEVDNDHHEQVKISRAVKEEEIVDGKSSPQNKALKEENSNNVEKKNVVNEVIKDEQQKQRNDENEMKRKLTKDKNYVEDDDDENSLRIMTPPVEEMSVDEVVPEQAPPPLIAEVQPIMRSEERRKEKKKSKKAKHHHHHRHHDRKRDSPPAATILHSSENDIMKLKIKLTEVNSKVPKYSVVDGNSDERKEPKENGHSHKLADKEKEKFKEREKSSEKNKIKEEEPKLIAEIVKDKNEYNNGQNSRVEPICKDKLQQQIRPPRPKITNKPVINTKPPVPVKQDVANVKPIMQSPPIKIQSPPPRQSPSPKSAPSPKPAPISKPSPPPTPKLNGTLEPLKMPPSTITVSKITAEEKRQMEQQKLLMSRNNNNGLDSKRPSLEIMLVNAPKKAETLASSAAQQLTEAKPVAVKKVIRPTPPSIPLSRLGKGVGFGPKGSPPPLVLANKATCHDETGALDLSGKSSRKSPEIDKIAMRNLMTLSDTAVQVRNGIMPDLNTTTNSTSQLKIPIPGLTKPVYQAPHQRTIKPGQNQTVRQIPNPSALMFRQHTINGRSLPPPGVPLSSLTKMESMTRNLEKVTACLSVKAAGEAAAYASK